MFYAAMARARRLGSLNPCGMFRRIVETAAYRGYIADCDDDQARAWLAEEQPPALNPTDAHDFLHLIAETPAYHRHLSQTDNKETLGSIIPKHSPTDQPEDAVMAVFHAHRLQEAGFPIHDAFNLIMATHEGRRNLAGWTQERWDRALNHGNFLLA